VTRDQADKIMALLDDAWWQQARELPDRSRALYVQLFKALPYDDVAEAVARLVLTSTHLPRIAEVVAALGVPDGDVARLRDAVKQGRDYRGTLRPRWRDTYPEAGALPEPVDRALPAPPAPAGAFLVADRPYNPHGVPA
jgi:hypothetical protein